MGIMCGSLNSFIQSLSSSPLPVQLSLSLSLSIPLFSPSYRIEREKMVVGGGKRFAVLLCAEDSEYVKKLYGGYFGVFVKMLAEEGEKWDVFRVAAGEFPEDGEIWKYEGFVITGSCSDAHSNEAWICRLLTLLNKLDSMKKRILGICFGHQILGRAIGGKVGRATSGWDIGVRSVHLSSDSSKMLPISTTLSIIEFHQDEVLELPEKAQVIAWSNKTGIEMFKYEDHIMGIQGHPEYTKEILSHLIERLLSRNLIQESVAEKARKAHAEASEPDREAWKKICINFLKGCDRKSKEMNDL